MKNSVSVYKNNNMQELDLDILKEGQFIRQGISYPGLMKSRIKNQVLFYSLYLKLSVIRGKLFARTITIYLLIFAIINLKIYLVKNLHLHLCK